MMSGLRHNLKKVVATACIITIVLSTLLVVSAEAISTSVLAGAGDSIFKDGKASEACFNQPYGLALDKDGGLLAADSINNRIRKIKDGQVTTVAGGGDKPDSFGMPLGGYIDGDVGKAMFNKPRAVAVNSKGEIFVADTGNNVIRKIAGGKVYTFAGNGRAGYSDGKGNTVTFNCPAALAVDTSDTIYVADSLNNVIRKITVNGEVTTLAGKYSENGGYADGAVLDSLFNEPSGVALDKEGAIYVLDSGNQMVRKIKDGEVTTLAGAKSEIIEGTNYLTGGFANGKASEARFNFPKGICVSDGGTIFIADTWNNRVRAIRADGAVVTVMGSGKQGRKDGELSIAELNAPSAVLYYSGTLYISDMWNNCIRTVKADTGSLTGIVDRSELTQGIDFGAASSDVKVYYDKMLMKFPDTKPYVKSGKVYIPLRFVFETWGAKVGWNQKTREISIVKGGFTKLLDSRKAPVVYKDQRTMLELNSLSGITGLRVEWYPEYNAVLIVSK